MRVFHLRRVTMPSRNKAMIRVNLRGVKKAMIRVDLRGVKRADAAIVVIPSGASSGALKRVLHKC